MHGIEFCKIQLKTKVCELEIVPTSRVEFQHYIFLVVKKTPLQQRLLCCAPARPRRLPDGIEGFGAAPNRTLTEYIVSLRSASCMACVQLASF